MDNYLLFYTFMLCMGHLMAGLEERLYTDLFKRLGYLRSVRPGFDKAEQVEFGLSLQSILELDAERELLSTNLWLNYEWTDASLKWNRTHYGGLRSLRVNIDEIWIPDITPYNGYHHEYIFDRQTAVLYSSGKVSWVPPVKLTTTCSMDMTRYPYDRQICPLKFGSWTYDGSKLNLTSRSDYIDISTYSENPGYKLEGYKCVRHVVTYECCPEPYIDITCTITVQRRSSYVTHIVISPSILMALLLPVLFILPPESRGKITLGIGLLITDAVLLLSIIDAIPGSSHINMPLIGVYHLVNMTLVCISLAISTVVMNIWDKSNRSKLLPSWISALILRPLSKILCVPKHDIMYEASHQMEGYDSPNNGDKDQIMTSGVNRASAVEWRQLAIIIDRLCFIIFTFVVILCVIVFSSK